MEGIESDKLVSRKVAASILGVCAETLRAWEHAGRKDPPVVRVGRLAKYRLADVRKVIDRQLPGPSANGAGK